MDERRSGRAEDAQRAPASGRTKPQSVPAHRLVRDSTRPSSTQRRRRLKLALGLLALTLAAAALRLYGIRWGLPHPGRYYPYHPDESVVIYAITQLGPFRGDFLPTFYNYGSLYLLLCRVAIDFAAGYGFLNATPKSMPVWIYDFAKMILIGRLVAVILAVGTVVLTALTARRLYGARAGWLAGLFLAVAPMHVVLAHYMAVDVPSAFFTALCLFLCALALPPRTVDRRTAAGDVPFRARTWLAIGAAAGLAASVKYNAGVVVLAGLVPLSLQYPLPVGPRQADGREVGGAAGRSWAAWLAGGALLAVGAIGALLLATPGIVLESKRFWMDLSYELEHSRRGHGDIFRYLPPAWVYHLKMSLSLGLGWPLLATSLSGVAWALWRRRPAETLLLLAIVPYYLVLAPADLRFVRYVVPLLPPLCILAAGFLVWVAARCRLAANPRARRVRPAPQPMPPRRGRIVALMALYAFAMFIVGAASTSSLAHDRVLAAEDPREAAARFVLTEMEDGEMLALAADPWFQTPPIDPSAGCVKVATPFGGPPAWNVGSGSSSGTIEPVPFYGGWLLAPRGSPHDGGRISPEALSRFKPKRVVITDYDYADPLRIRENDAKYSKSDATLRLWDELKRSYHLEREFRARPELGGLEWFRRETPPHDWAYFMPTIQVYRRNE